MHRHAWRGVEGRVRSPCCSHQLFLLSQSRYIVSELSSTRTSARSGFGWRLTRVARLLAEVEEARAVRLALVVSEVVDLEGGMGDTVLAREEVFELAAARVAVLATADQDVGRERREAGGDLPDVQVVDLRYALGAGHPAADLFGADAAGGSLE